MLFNSLDFAVFLPIVFLLYWFATKGHLAFQNVLIVVASYVFYAFWDWRFLALIIFSTFLDFSIGLLIARQQNKRKQKLLLWASVAVNLGFLGFFKYYNFFLSSFVSAFSFFGAPITANSLNIILPVGISFYTFQTLSYTIDVYRKKLPPTTDFIAFAAFVSFFPQLVAGPIERATNLLPQFYAKRQFSYAKATDGMKQILWGLFKKMVIADNCAEVANQIFTNSSDYSGSTLVVGVIFFSFQIYGDFSGYSDIAIGSSKLFGFNLNQNFNFPYFSRNIAEFWRRWHISLSTWFRDYLYIPLGGSRGNTTNKIRNTFIIFIVSGFWHGANLTFIFWGALHALFFLPLLITNKNRNFTNTVAQGKLLPTAKEVGLMLLTFCLTSFAWIFFRAENLTHALGYISSIFSQSFFSLPYFLGIKKAALVGGLLLFFLAVEWLGREKKYGLESLVSCWKKPLKWGFYYFIAMLIFLFGTQSQDFIYFQF